MKKIAFAIVLCLSLATMDVAAAKKFKREVTKEMAVGAEPVLRIDNKYGNLRIIEGTENKIMFNIEITGEGATDELAKAYAESVDINFAHAGDLVSAETVLHNINCHNNCGRSIQYVVVAPKKVMMNLQNKYGNIQTGNAIRPLAVDLKYGNLETGALGEAKIDIKYGHATIQSCDELMLDCKYSTITLGRIDRLQADSGYDKFRIESVGECRLNTGYTDVQIGKLEQSFDTEIKYGALEIAEVATDFSRIKIEAKYTNIKIGLNESHSFKASLHTKYGKFHSDTITLNDVSLKNADKDKIEGRAGTNANPEATVEIDVSYGNITFK
jgi:hypothetical protein